MADKQASPLTSKLDLDFDLRGFSTRNFLIFSILFFFGLIAFVIWVIVPQFNAIFDNRSRLTEVQDELKVYQEKLKQINAVTNSSDFAQASKVNSILYDTNPYVEVLYALSQVASDYNIVFDRFEFSPGLIASASAQYAARQSMRSSAARNANVVNSENYTIYIEAKGSYYNLVSFLHELESYAPFNSVAYSEISNNLLGEAVAQIEILALYYTPKAIVNIDQPLPTLSQQDQETLRALNQFTIPDYDEIFKSQLVGGREDIFTLGQLEVEIPEELVDADASSLGQ